MTRRSWWILAASIAALAIAAAASSLANGFAYDDIFVIVKPRQADTASPWWSEFSRTYWARQYGGDGYRPITTLLFRAQWILGDGTPQVFHAVNVGLHVLGAVLVFWLACAALPLAAAWIAAALYAVHPVHVEAIANVVGQSELLAGVLLVVAVGLHVHGARLPALGARLSAARWVAIGVLYAIACLVKEHALVLPALLLLAEATIVRDDTPLRRRLVQMRAPVLGLLAIAAAYLWMRDQVVTNSATGFRPFVVFRVLDVSAGDRVLTMIGAAHEWLRLLLWPARLMTEYAPQYIDVASGPSVGQLGGLVVLLGVLGLMVACWRRIPATAFGIGWAVLTLLPASNFIVPAGFIMAERTLLAPSIGAMIALASVVPWVYQRFEQKSAALNAAAVVVALLLVLGVARSHSRNRAWRDNATIVRQAVVDSPDSYRAHFMYAVHLFENEHRAEGERHYRRAMELFPYDPLMVYGLAEQYRRAGMCEPALPLYRWLRTIDAASDRGRLEHAVCLLSLGRFDDAKAEALHGLRVGARVRLAHLILAAAKESRTTLQLPAP